MPSGESAFLWTVSHVHDSESALGKGSTHLFCNKRIDCWLMISENLWIDRQKVVNSRGDSYVVLLSWHLKFHGDETTQNTEYVGTM